MRPDQSSSRCTLRSLVPSGGIRVAVGLAVWIPLVVVVVSGLVIRSDSAHASPNITTVPTSGHPLALAVDQATGRVMVAEAGDSVTPNARELQYINDQSTPQVGYTFPSATSADSEAVAVTQNPATGHSAVLVGNGVDNTVTLLDAPTSATFSPVTVTNTFGGLYKAGTKLTDVIANPGVPGGFSLRQNILSPFPIFSITSIGYNSANGWSSADTVLFFPSCCPTEHSLLRMAIDPGHAIYITDQGTGAGDGGIYTVDPTALSSSLLLEPVLASTAVTHPFAIAVNPKTRLAYVTDPVAQTLTVLDGNRADSSGHVPVQATIHLDSSPRGVAVNPLTDDVFVALPNTGAVAVIDGRTNLVTDTISLGPNTQPSAIAADSTRNVIYVTHDSPQDHSVSSFLD